MTGSEHFVASEAKVRKAKKGKASNRRQDKMKIRERKNLKE